MSDTRVLLNRIAAIRQRLGQAQGMLLEAHTEAVDLVTPGGKSEQIEEKVAGANRVQTLLDKSLRQITGLFDGTDEVRPKLLTNRVRRCLERCAYMVSQLRELQENGEFERAEGDSPPAQCHRHCAAMTEAAVRFVQAFPDAPAIQVHLCEGLEGILDAVNERIGRLSEAVARQKHGDEQIAELVHAFSLMARGDRISLDIFTQIAAVLDGDSRLGRALHFLDPGPISQAADTDAAIAWRYRLIATHALNTAQVIARVVREHPDFQRQPLTPIVSALICNVGHLTTPTELLAHPGRLSAEQLLRIEDHPARGAAIVARQIPQSDEFIEVIRQHHERLDGTGYPAGIREPIPVARLLAVCDVYTALMAPRPHREARDPRTALTETLLLASRGVLDRGVADALLRLGFYPAGSIVELLDGRLGVVVANHPDPAEPHRPARPVIALLTDADGTCLTSPCCVDLGADETCAVARALIDSERRVRLGEHYPQLA